MRTKHVNTSPTRRHSSFLRLCMICTSKALFTPPLIHIAILLLSGGVIHPLTQLTPGTQAIPLEPLFDLRITHCTGDFLRYLKYCIGGFNYNMSLLIHRQCTTYFQHYFQMVNACVARLTATKRVYSSDIGNYINKVKQTVAR